MLHAASSSRPLTNARFTSVGDGGADAGVREHRIPHRGSRRFTIHPVGLRQSLGAGDLPVLHEGWEPNNLIAGASSPRARVS